LDKNESANKEAPSPFPSFSSFLQGKVTAYKDFESKAEKSARLSRVLKGGVTMSSVLKRGMGVKPVDRRDLPLLVRKFPHKSPSVKSHEPLRQFTSEEAVAHCQGNPDIQAFCFNTTKVKVKDGDGEHKTRPKEKVDMFFKMRWSLEETWSEEGRFCYEDEKNWKKDKVTTKLNFCHKSEIC
jgi:hypothetical protein